jgi:hypothetical protein
MTDKTITVAGESLEDIEAALDLFELAIDDHGRLVMTAALPQRLSQSLNRAIKTITAEMTSGRRASTFNERSHNPVDELFTRVAETREAQG